MKWNWELAEWPNFSWDQATMEPLENRFLSTSGFLAGTMRHVDQKERTQISIESLSEDSLATSQIEGEVLDRASVQSSIQKALGLQPSQKNLPKREQGIAALAIAQLAQTQTQLDHLTLHEWHQKLFQLREIEGYRTGEDPMQIISGSYEATKIHYEAPPSSDLPQQMTEFIEWFNTSAPGSKKPLKALTRAGIAHLYFESIHPYEDGNGRLGRALVEKSLSQSMGEPLLVGVANSLLKNQKEYYRQLEAASTTLEVTTWLTWFGERILEAQKMSLDRVEFILAKSRMMESLRSKINERQEKALLRMFQEGPDGFKGGLSAENYQKITGALTATATRDLSDLVSKGALRREGERRYARYYLRLD